MTQSQKADSKQNDCLLSAFFSWRSRIKNNQKDQGRKSPLASGQLGKCTRGRTLQFRYAAGQRICDAKRDMTILDVYKGTIACSPYMYKLLTYRCNRCGYVNEGVRECTILRGTGCPVCSGKTIKKGFNDIPSQAPWMIPYFPGGIAEAGLYTPNSGRRLRLVCPYCGKLSDHPVAIATLHQTHSIGCPCGDGISFPEKFVFHFFQAISSVRYTRQISAKDFPWCGRYRYDGMFQKDGKRYLIEIHGIQHFEHSGYERIASADLAATKENDRQKKLRAIENGIPEQNYIVLDCRKSTLPHLQMAILTSPLADILGLHDMQINWEGIFVSALVPLHRNILDYAQSHPFASTKEIARLYGVHPSYPARILRAYGAYGKSEQAQRKSKAFYENKRRRLFSTIEQMLDENPDITVSEIAARLGKNASGVYAMLRRYRHEHNINMDALHRNAEKIRLSRARDSICKPVCVIAPDGAQHEFPGLTEACKSLSQAYEVQLPVSSVSVALSQARAFRGFTFRYRSPSSRNCLHSLL